MCDFVDLIERQQSDTEYCAYRVANLFRKKRKWEFDSSFSSNNSNSNNKEMRKETDKMPNTSGMNDEQVKDLKYKKKTSSHSGDMAKVFLLNTKRISDNLFCFCYDYFLLCSKMIGASFFFYYHPVVAI